MRPCRYPPCRNAFRPSGAATAARGIEREKISSGPIRGYQGRRIEDQGRRTMQAPGARYHWEGIDCGKAQGAAQAPGETAAQDRPRQDRRPRRSAEADCRLGGRADQTRSRADRKADRHRQKIDRTQAEAAPPIKAHRCTRQNHLWANHPHQRGGQMGDEAHLFSVSDHEHPPDLPCNSVACS